MTLLPPLARTALLLDIDGTLLDFAPTPDSVIIPPGLCETLATLQGRLDGALAFVTGRAIPTVDGFFGGAFATAGEHGGAIRHAPGGPIERPDLPGVPDDWVLAAEALVAAHPGALLERKARGFALHFRLAPSAGEALYAGVTAMLAGSAAFHLLPGSMMWEVRPVGADKGSAVAALMERSPFAGRVPVFLGDDVTDEDGFRVARAMGGAGLFVPDAFGGPEAVRTWLARAASDGAWPSVQ